MAKKPAIIDLDPREWRAEGETERPGKRPHEPFFGSGALEWGVFILSWAVIAGATHWLGLR